ncbi:uncharacterized protein A4U43_C07F37860 [Asparagus officinalis]|uniref:Isopenicillin N synthase-like Fe(2+) 2OG dioxygenase domain-containing protein n=1 Tax=Asparagus officinalis TaxID=4686 RepID=A0A5P1ELS9_ASPOF|nr:uncharacterized protein A4U43_C07F37860 [Asparagus officinalis]
MIQTPSPFCAKMIMSTAFRFVWMGSGLLHVSPRPNTFVINIGDTFMAQTNKRYKSCMHRAVVSSTTTRKTMVYFVSPEMDKTVRPPEELVDAEHPRAYPDFTWGMLKEFTRKHHTPDTQTLTAFVEWLKKKKEKESGNE